MPNIFLTSKCNLKCSYCFADEFVNKQYQEMSEDNFNKVLEYLKKSNEHSVGLIGGEPTLYPHFSKILKTLAEDSNIKNVCIYTNGLEIDKYIDDISSDKFYLLVNCNSPKEIGDNFNKLKKNVELLEKHKKGNFTLGINIFPNIDYSFIFDLLSLTTSDSLRYSVAISNLQKNEATDILKDYREIKPLMFNFLNDCLKNSVVPQSDCNSIPNCLLDKEEMKLIIKLNYLIDQKGLRNKNISFCYNCFPVLDILPDLSVVRCFAMSKYLKVKLEDFKTLSAIRKFFFNSVDIYAKISNITKECTDCRYRLLDSCGVCYEYKIKHIDKIKSTINEQGFYNG